MRVLVYFFFFSIAHIRNLIRDCVSDVAVAIKIFVRLVVSGVGLKM